MCKNKKIIELSPVSLSESGERLDKWICSKTTEISRSRLKNLIEEKKVLRNGTVIDDVSFKVKTNDFYTITLPPPDEPTPIAEKIDLQIVFEDDDLIVIDKPAGMVVHPAPGNSSGTLVNALISHCGNSLSGIGGVKRPGIVHRIDKDTSGLIVVAKNDYAHQFLSEQFAAHNLKRAYKAIVWGTPVPHSGTIIGNIGRSNKDRKKMAVLKTSGKHAITHYKTIKSFGKNASLIECRLETGRTHQIRVHMQHIGHPLIGDPVYGSKNLLKTLNETQTIAIKNFKRQALHAFELGFTHPKSKKDILFLSETPFDFKSLINNLELE